MTFCQETKEVNYKYNAEQVHILGNRPVMGQECRQAQNTCTSQCKQKPHVMTKKKKKKHTKAALVTLGITLLWEGEFMKLALLFSLLSSFT